MCKCKLRILNDIHIDTEVASSECTRRIIIPTYLSRVYITVTSNYRHLDCLIKRLFRRRSKKTLKFRVTGLVRGIHRWPVVPLTKGQQRGKCFHLMTPSCNMSQGKCARLAGIRTVWKLPYAIHHSLIDMDMMTSSNGNIFRVPGHLCWEFTGPRWIPSTKASDAELWCFLWSVPE